MSPVASIVSIPHAGRLEGASDRPEFEAIIFWFWQQLSGWAHAAVPAGDWPMFRGLPALTGVAAGNLPERPGMLWTFGRVPNRSMVLA